MRPYWETTLKWKAEIGPVATPATSEVTTMPSTGLAKRQPRETWVCTHQAWPRSVS